MKSIHALREWGGRLLRDPADPHWAGFLLRWMGLALVFHLIAGVFSVGHHSADEYFQILEFVNYKLGRIDAADLPVEFGETMRPWLAPAFYTLVAKLWLALGIDNPHFWAMTFRWLAGFLGWGSGVALAVASRFWFPDPRARRFAVASTALLWFLPALHVRPSSENLSGSAFLLGLVLFFLGRSGAAGSGKGRVLWLASGLFFGLAFEFRFQIAFMVFGALAWLVWQLRREPRLLLARLGWTILGGMSVFVLGRLIDAWGYGISVWDFGSMSPWKYVDYNLIRNEVNRYRHAPWWDFLRMSFTESWPVLGLLLALASLLAWLRHPAHILTWSQVPFFLVHELIPHKELRFFFPIALAGPVLLTLALTARRTGKFAVVPPGLPKKALTWLGGFIVINNLLALVALLFLPFARNVQFYEGLYRHTERNPGAFELFTAERDPFDVLGSRTRFYRPKTLVIRRFATYGELEGILKARPDGLWLFTEHGFELPPEADSLKSACTPVVRTLPDWLVSLNFGNWLSRAHVWTLYRCERR